MSTVSECVVGKNMPLISCNVNWQWQCFFKKLFQEYNTLIANHDSEWHCPAIQWPVTNGSSWSHLTQCPARPGQWPGLAGLCSKVWSLQARPGKAQSLTGPCRALPEGLQGLVTGPLLDFAGILTYSSGKPCNLSKSLLLYLNYYQPRAQC